MRGSILRLPPKRFVLAAGIAAALALAPAAASARSHPHAKQVRQSQIRLYHGHKVG